MKITDIYWRAIAMLAPERSVALLLTAASMALACVQLAEPVLFGWVVDALSNKKSALDLIGLWAALGFLGILAGVIVAIYADRLAHRRRLAAMADAFERAIALPLGFHAERGSGAVTNTILRGTNELFWVWLGVMREQMTAIVGVLLLIPTAISVDARMTAILALLAIAYTFLNLYVVGRTRADQTNVETYHSEVTGRVVDVLGNVTVVQSYTRLAAESQALKAVMGNLLAAQYPVLTWWGILTILQRAAATIAMVAIFAIGALLAARGELSVGEIVSFVAFANLLIGKLDQISGFFVRVQQAAPALDKYFELVDEQPAIADRPGALELANVKGEVAYQDVSFHFPGTSQGVEHLDFRAASGETIALVGPTGSGKSTTMAILQRLRAPDAGRITVDGQDIADCTQQSLRANVGVVFQDAGLFNRSIGDNIRIGRPDATDAEVERAARLAEAHDFILRKPNGYGFLIGERGAALSGGERQRIALARAILKDAPILILDEATSALDAETEARIKRALDALRKGRTTFIIAHRLSTVADAHQILVLDQGRIIERGTFSELSEAGGLFARMIAQGGFTAPRTAQQEPISDLNTDDRPD
ncbi:MAG: glucan ABC transporter ATP-binding protein/ permease [Hyphomicrobiaceae bacterium]|nr:glucan ABC transporter ATP-binding protein/ permease [Hyphomicrobiaceae bacterium]